MLCGMDGNEGTWTMGIDGANKEQAQGGARETAFGKAGVWDLFATCIQGTVLL